MGKILLEQNNVTTLLQSISSLAPHQSVKSFITLVLLMCCEVVLKFLMVSF